MRIFPHGDELVLQISLLGKFGQLASAVSLVTVAFPACQPHLSFTTNGYLTRVTIVYGTAF